MTHPPFPNLNVARFPILPNLSVARCALRVERFFLLSLLFLSFAALPAAAKPNLLLIFVDDMGYADPGCYGGTLVPTPNIDALAAAGVRFTDGYVTAPVCAPSRCGLMAGVYGQRFGMQWNDDQHATPRQYRIPDTHKLLPETLRAAGYRTGLVGKWNLPRDPKAVFDETFSVMDWEGDYFPGPDGRYHGVDDPVNRGSAKVQGVWGPERPDDEYLTDRLGRQAADFITRHRGTPFFLYCAFNAVHTPLHAKKTADARLRHITDEPLRFYAAMLASLDDNIGRILDALKSAGQAENTVVAFLSDNGPAMGSDYIKVWPGRWPQKILLGSAGPLRGHKGQYYEGGIRIPYLLRWPARLSAATTCRHPVSSMDIYATFCEAAGVPVPDGTTLDGVSLLPFLDGTAAGTPHETLFWLTDGRGAVRRGDWKLVVSPAKPKLQLFNLAEDIGETRDLADANTVLRDTLHDAWLAWQKPFPPRANPPPVKRGGAVTGTFAPVTLTAPDGKTFTAYTLTDDSGQAHLIYHRLIKDRLDGRTAAECRGRRMRVSGTRTQTGSASVFDSVDALQLLP